MLVGGKAKRTLIFARMNNFGEQVLIVALQHAEAAVDTALVLPLPVKPGGRCAFADIGGYEELFVDLDKCWEPSLVISDNPRLEAELAGVMLEDGALASNGVFFQTRADLARLDPKMRPPAAAMAGYADWGFAVFRLPAGETGVKPLALVFESREPNKVFFPTLTVVDGNAPPKVRMDQRLYLQTWTGRRLENWLESDVEAAEHVDLKRSRGLVRGELRLQKIEIRGERKNEDTWARLPLP